MCWLAQTTVSNRDRNWYANEGAADNTTEDTDPFNHKELLHKPIELKKKTGEKKSSSGWNTGASSRRSSEADLCEPSQPVKDTLFCL